MKLLNLRQEGGLALGVATDKGVIDVSATSKTTGIAAPATLAALLQDPGQGSSAVAKIANSQAAVISEAAIGPASGIPGKILCVGLNYRAHALESNSPIPESPVLFSKFTNAICANGDDVPIYPVAEQFDYEVELGVLIGKAARNVSLDNALDHVFGYITANDISVRDLQKRTSQWLLGKTLDNFLPNGPYLVTADEAGDPQAMQLQTWVNGSLRQDSSTADMIFSVAEIISYVSQYFTLEPGDFIVTGTPQGVAMGLPGTPWLVPGDVVEVQVGNLGRLRNQMVAG